MNSEERFMRTIRNLSIAILALTVVIALQTRVRAFGDICDNFACFCGGGSIECPEYEDCAADYPDFCPDVYSECAGQGVLWCDPGNCTAQCLIME
jgi:hypothetical protein